ncbi:alpha/beta-hydrolase [Collybia nuda]|uniref:Alpha/beta-hydrolase n=1 Tax=Collybia nuda TaxID=64659 RepID=A0A9P5Y654_9AGAR|nr:alpha/beta-hydrolase [Collybia nuda]
MAKFTRETIRIPTKDKAVCLHVWLYRPDVPAPFPVVVAGHGMTMIKDAGLATFGEIWATQAGYASLIFDYRYFGDSDGEPRNLVSLDDQLEDYKTVIAWARSQPKLFLRDKIVLMGFSLSGFALSELAVKDPDLAGAIAICPMLDGYDTLKLMPFDPRLVFWAIVDTIKAKIGLSRVFIKAIGRPHEFSLLHSPGSYPGFIASYSHGSTSFEETPNLITPRVVFEMMGTRSGRALKSAGCPVLFVTTTDDDLIPAKIAREIAASATTVVTLVETPGGHFDLLAGGKGFDTSVSAQLEFLGSLR